jgi:hypothetical protein
VVSKIYSLKENKLTCKLTWKLSFSSFM